MKKKIFSILLSLAMVITMMPMATMTALAVEEPPVKILYWGYEDVSKTLYLSATEEAITNKEATANAFNSAVSYIDSEFPWKEHRESVEHVEILNDIAPGSTANWFEDMKEITEIEGIEHLDTSNVWDMDSMFLNCESLESLDVSKFNTSNVTDMMYMFSGCEALESLDVSNFDTSKVNKISTMFGYCKALTYLDLSGLDMSSVDDVNGTKYMFAYCEALESVNLSNVNASNVEDMSEMFKDSKALTSINFTNFKTSSANDMLSMFEGCEALTSLNLSSFETSNVTGMSKMFSGCKKLKSLNLSSFDTSNVTSMASMFSDCEKLKSLDLSNFNTSKVKRMALMFNKCTSLKSLDLSSFDMTSLETATSMFGNAPITYIKTPKNVKINVKLPTIAEPMKWLYADTLDEYGSVYLPTNSAESITLVAGVPVSTWSALQEAINNTSGDATTPATKTTNIIFKNDITASSGDSAITIPEGKKIVLDLNGHVLNRGLVKADGTVTLNDHGSVIDVYGELTINDSVPTTQHEGFVDSKGLWHLGTGAGTPKTIKGGIITGGTGIKVEAEPTEYQGGGIFINGNGKVTMESGTIAGNSVRDFGGGIRIEPDGEFTMFGGSITYNSAYEDGAGGGIYSDGTCKLNGGTITNNSATYGGGCATTGSCTLEKTTITDNNAATCGGGIYSYSYGSTPQLTVSGSTDISIKGNTSTTNQGNNIATDSPIIINTALANAEMYVTFVNSNVDETTAGALTSGYINKNPGAKLDDFFHYDGPNTYYMDWNDGNTELVVKQVPSGKKAISIPSIPNGKVTADKQIAASGDSVTLTVTPDSGYELEKLTYTYEGNTTPIDITSTKSFTMPDKAVTISATFKESTEPTPAKEKYSVPVEGDSSVKVEATIENEKAKVSEITKKDLEEFVENTESKTNVDSLELDFTKAKQDVMGVEFTKPTLENVQEVLESKDNKITNLVVKMSEGTVSLDAKALEAVTEQANGDTIILVVDKTQGKQLSTAKQETLKDYNVNKTFEAYFESNGQRIHDFKGGVATLSMKFEPTQGSNTKNYKIYYLDDNAKMHKYATKYEKGMLVFATTHFSDYAIVYDGRVDVLLAQAKSSKGKIKLSWNGLDNITKYVVYGARCGQNYKKLKTTTGKSYTVKKASGKKLKAHKTYKFYVVAYDAVGNKISSRAIHCIYKNTQGKYANVKSIKAKYDNLLLSVGVTKKIGAKYKMYAGKKHLKKTHGQVLKFFTNNTDVVTVSSGGTVKAVGKGTATIYIQDIGGKYCKTKVTVE